MKSHEGIVDKKLERYQSLVSWGLLSQEDLDAVGEASAFRDADAERIILQYPQLTRRKLLESLSAHYGCPWTEYDERLPVPSELLSGLDADMLCESLWFPMIKDGNAIVIAASDPSDPLVLEQAKRIFHAEHYELRVALADDISWLIQDYLHAPPEHLIGNERTGLAFWRNTMARWRTRLACYRTDFAIARTHFGTLRWGLGLITAGRSLLNVYAGTPYVMVYRMMIFLGFVVIGIGAFWYFRLKRSVISPPRFQTLVEVTAATLHFLENYQFAPRERQAYSDKQTMLSRLSELLPNSCVFIQNSPDNKVRSFLAHERNAMAAQRTVLACYRTIYSRARTGLSFIRTGVAFASIGFGMIEYFGLSLLTLVDGFVILGGSLLVLDGIAWYWPVRKEQREAPDFLEAPGGTLHENRA